MNEGAYYLSEIKAGESFIEFAMTTANKANEKVIDNFYPLLKMKCHINKTCRLFII